MGDFLKKPVKDILFVTVGYTLGGSENMIAHIAPRLKNRGYKIRVLAFKNWGPVSDKIKGFGIECLSLQGKGKFDFRVLWRYFIYLKKAPPDLIIAFLYRAYIPSRILGSILGTPTISSVRDVQKWISPLRVFLEKMTSNMSFIIYSCSNAVTQFLIKQIGIKKERIATIPNGIDADAYDIKINKEKKIKELGLNCNLKIVGTVCRLHEKKKGVKVLFNATKILKKDIDFQLLIVGTGKDERMLRSMAEKEGIDVRFLGEREDVREILQVLDVFVLSSLYEGFPVAVLEAMAARVPVVVSKVGNLSEVVVNGKTGFLVPVANPEELAKGIKNLLKNDKMRKDFGKAGFKRVKEKFSIEVTVDSIEKLWKGKIRWKKK